MKSEARRRYLERHCQPIDSVTVLNTKGLLRAGETEVYARGRDGRPALGKRERNLLDHLIKEDKLDAGIRLVKLEDANTPSGARGPTATRAPSTGTGYEVPYTLSQMRWVLSCMPPTSIRGVLRVSLSPSSSCARALCRTVELTMPHFKDLLTHSCLRGASQGRLTALATSLHAHW